MRQEKEAEQIFAVVRIRGSAKTRTDVNDAAEKLGLKRVNHCAVIPADKTHIGLLKKASSRLTWGEISEEMLIRLIEKRGRTIDGSRLEPKAAKPAAEKIFKAKSVKGSGICPVFRLSPPSKGLRSVRLHHPRGDLGYRGGKINQLLERML
jgi:large subunit ribosomal protein L30